MSIKNNLKTFFNDLWSALTDSSMGNVGRKLPLVVMLAGVAIIHIANNHIAEDKIRQINKMEKQIKELRWDYMTSKSELMYNSKQTEVARKVADLELKELVEPPYKIVLNDNVSK